RGTVGEAFSPPDEPGIRCHADEDLLADAGRPRRLRRGRRLGNRERDRTDAGDLHRAASILQIAEPVFLPPRTYAGLVVGRRPHGRWQALVVPPRPLRHLPRARGVDEHAVPEPGAELGDVAVLEWRRRIDRRAEAARKDHDAALAGVHAMGEGPVDLLVRRRVDVVLDD